MITNDFRDVLGNVPYLNDALDRITAQFSSIFQKQHDADGAHTDITCDSITIAETLTVADAITIGDSYLDADGPFVIKIDGTSKWTINSTGDLLPTDDHAQDIGTSDTPLDTLYAKFVAVGDPATTVLDATTLTFIGAGTITTASAQDVTLQAGTGNAIIANNGSGTKVKLVTTGGSFGWVQWSSQEATGGGSAALGTNCPAGTATAPYTWFKLQSSDGSTVYIPVWK